MVLVLVATSRYGAGLTTDSVTYISVARNLRAGTGLIAYDGTPLVAQPPLYPIVLAVVAFIARADPLGAAAFVNAFLFGAIVSLTGLLCARVGLSFAFAALGMLLVLCSRALLEAAVTAWSEPLFILLTLAFLLAQEKFLVTRERKLFFLMCLAAALACLTRYIGVTLILSGALTLLLCLPQAWRVRARLALSFATLATLPPGLFVLRNYFVSGTFLGPRASSAYALSENLQLVLRTILNWYSLDALATRYSILPFVGAAVVLMLAFLVKRNPLQWRNAFALAVGMMLFSVVYAAFLIASATFTAFDPLGDRLLSPVLVPLTLVLVLGLENVYKTLGQIFSNKWAPAFSVCVVALWLSVPAVLGATANTLEYANDGAGGFNRKLWRESAMIRYLEQHPFNADSAVFSNAPDALYILANLRVQASPQKTEYNSDTKINDPARGVTRMLENDGSYLIWFNAVTRSYLYTVDELRTLVKMQPAFQFGDGTLYRISRQE